MKTILLEKSTLESCVKDSRSDRVIVTRRGKPVALMVSTRGMDLEQLELSTSPKFWKLITERRKEKTMSRAELDAAIAEKLRQRKPRA